MDPNVVTLNKFLRSSCVTQGSDLISSLPEGILTSILSRLPTRDAVQTSILSTKWINLWTSITKVDFDDTLFQDVGKTDKENMTRFVNFVNRVLLHLDNSTIQVFSLKLSNRQYDPCVPSSWISAALKRQVQNLHIRNADNAFISSRSLVNCHSLVQLVLEMNCTIKVPYIFHLPNLQVLRLDRVRFVKNIPTHSKDIILIFPSLKVFEARQCVWFNIILVAPMLESFSFTLFDHLLSNDEIVELQNSVFKIRTSPSTKFSYRGHLLHNFILLDPPSTFKASAEIFIDEYIEERAQKTCFRCHMLLKHFHEAKCLKLKLNKLLQSGNDHYFANLPIFGRLVYLEVETVGAETMLNILNNSKNLKTLVVKDATLSFDENVVTSATAPPCFESSLKDVQFKQFRGILCEFTLVKFVLKNATILEHMTIFPYWLLRDSDIGFMEVKRKILSFPRRSNVVSIEFSI